MKKTTALTTAAIEVAVAAGKNALITLAAENGIQAKGMANSTIVRALNNKMKAVTGKLSKTDAPVKPATKVKRTAKSVSVVDEETVVVVTQPELKLETPAPVVKTMRMVDLSQVHTLEQFIDFMEEVKTAGKHLVFTANGEEVKAAEPTVYEKGGKKRDLINLTGVNGKKAGYFTDSTTHHISRYLTIA